MKRLLMTPDNYQAFVEGRKDVTRRFINPQPLDRETTFWKDGYGWFGVDEITKTRGKIFYPYYKQGENVVVVTRWAVCSKFDFLKPSQINLGHIAAIHIGKSKDDCAGKWRTARFLPLHLEPYFPKAEIISVRAERLQDISEEDAILEGARPELGEGLDRNGNYFAIVSHKLGFSLLWNSINAKRGYGWHTNPWVWRIEFKKCEP